MRRKAPVRCGSGEKAEVISSEPYLSTLPSKADPTSRTGYTNTARIADGAIRQQLTEAVVEQYHAEVENLKARVAAIMAPENSKEAKKEAKPPRIADQVKAAEKQAARHNAALPDQAKEGRVKNAER